MANHRGSVLISDLIRLWAILKSDCLARARVEAIRDIDDDQKLVTAKFPPQSSRDSLEHHDGAGLALGRSPGIGPAGRSAGRGDRNLARAGDPGQRARLR